MSFTGHYGLLTLGVQSAATRYVAHAHGRNDPVAMNRYINTGLALLAPAGLLSVLVGAGLAYFLEPLFHIPKEDLNAAQFACVLMALTTGVTFATAIFSSILTAHQRFDSLNVVKTGSIVVRSALTVWLLMGGHGIVALAVLSLAMAGVSGLGFLALARRQCPGWRIAPGDVDGASMKTVLGFGAKSLVGTASLTLVYQCDLFVIGMFLSPEHITIYALGSTLLFYIVQFVNSIVHVMDPYATERFAKEGVAGVRDLFVEGSAFIYGIGGVIVGCALAFAHPFFAVWISPDHVESGTILAILVIPQFFNMGARFGHSILVGMARIGTFNAVSLAGGIVNLILSVIFVKLWGIPGVAIATLIPMVAVDAIWFLPWISKLLGISPGRVWGRSVLPGVAIAAIGWGVGTLALGLHRRAQKVVDIQDYLEREE